MSHTTTLTVDECTYQVVLVLALYVKDVEAANQVHHLLIVTHDDAPQRFLASYLHVDGQRCLNTIVALQVDGLLVLADGRCRADGERHLALAPRVRRTILSAGLQP